MFAVSSREKRRGAQFPQCFTASAQGPSFLAAFFTSSPDTLPAPAAFHKMEVVFIGNTNHCQQVNTHIKHNLKQPSLQLFIITSWKFEIKICIPSSLFLPPLPLQKAKNSPLNILQLPGPPACRALQLIISIPKY